MKVVFLDRDGVINKYPGDKLYVTSLKRFRFLPGAKDAIAKLYKNGFSVFVASNQAGVGRGIYSQKTLDAITLKMIKEVEKSKGRFTGIYYCIHPKELKCSCRKPAPGMLKKCAREFGFKLKKAYFVGDTIRDVITAKRAGCKSILVLSGKEKLKNMDNWEIEPDFVFSNLKQAADFIIKGS